MIETRPHTDDDSATALSTELAPLRPVADAVVDHLPRFAPDACVVDLGCGLGEPGMSVLRRFPAVELIGVDASPAMLRRARRRAEWHPRARFLLNDLEHLDLPDGCADVVVSRFGLLGLEDVSRSVPEYARIAAPGSVFSVAVWDAAGGNTLVDASRRALTGLVDDLLLPDLDVFDERAASGGHVAALRAAGVHHVDTQLFTWRTSFRAFDQLWAVLTGPGLWAEAVATLDDDGLVELRRRTADLVSPYGVPGGAYLVPTTCRLLWGRR